MANPPRPGQGLRPDRTAMPLLDERLTCGCRLVEFAPTSAAPTTGLFHFYPCGEPHRTLANMMREPGSRIMVHAPVKS